MYLDPKVHEGIEEEVLEMQFGGWCFESHCWGPIDDNGMQTCLWCGMSIKTNTLLTKDFPICEKNELIAKRLEAQKQVKEPQAQEPDSTDGT